MGEGPMPAQIMLIGERPGEEEAYNVPPRPFIGLAGKYLDIFLANAGIARSNVYLTNLVKTFSAYGKPTNDEINRDHDILAEELIAVRPVVVGLLGTFAVESVLGWERANLERTHGIPVSMQGTDSTGRFVRTAERAIYLPMLHPAGVIYDSSVMPHCQTDFDRLAQLVEEYNETGKIETVVDKWAGRERYVVHPKSRVYEVRLDCAIDTEGWRKRPWCATFSSGYGLATLTYPGTRVQVNSELVYLHNSLHDLGVLRELGIVLGDDQFRDTMVWAYLLAIEPQGLKDLAWRKLGMEMMSYDEVIGDADRNVALEYLEGVAAGEWKGIEPFVLIERDKKTGEWGPKIHKPNSIGQRVQRILADVASGKTKKDGTPINPRERWGNIDDFVKQEVVEILGDMPEATLDDVPRGIAEVYACRDADATRRLGPILQSKIIEMKLEEVSEIDHGVIPMVDRMQEVGWQLAPASFWDALGEKCQSIMDDAQNEIEMETGSRINPDSGDQVAALLYDQLGIRPDRLTDTGKRGATNDKALEAIASKSPVVDYVFDYREASKVKSSFVAPLRKHTQSGDGRYRYGLRITRVSSGRLAGVGKPNLLAIPVRTDLGKEVRAGFVAAEGKCIGDWDLNQIEMREMADQSRDEGLVRIFVDGKIDVHTDTAANMFGIPYNQIDPDGPHRYAAKRVGFGVITGITEYGLVDQMALARAKRPDGQPWTVDDCANMINAWFDVRPGVRLYMEQCRDEARATGMVRDKWGRIRYLPGVWSPQKHVRGEAERQSHSFKISSSAQGVLKRALKQIWINVCKVGWLETEPLIQVHDEFVAEVPDDELRKTVVNDLVVGYLTQTTKYSSGIPVKAKGGYGNSWAAAK